MSRRKWILIPIAVVAVATAAVFAPCIEKVRDDEGWVNSNSQLRLVGHAIRQYYKANGHLPPAVVRGKDGTPFLGWRVLMLPFLDELDLYNKIRFDEPWDSPHNAPLVAECPRCYVPHGGGGDSPGLTRYQVVIGPGTAFERDRMTWDDFSNGLANTILVVESSEPVPWAKPADIEYAPDRPLPPLGAGYRKPVHFLCREIARRSGFNAYFADGNCRFIRSDTDEAIIRRLITRIGPSIDASKLD
jgi:hypothetical protein